MKKIFRDVLFVDIVDDFEVDFSLKVNICGIITGNKNLLNDTVKKVLNEGLESSIINEVNESVVVCVAVLINMIGNISLIDNSDFWLRNFERLLQKRTLRLRELYKEDFIKAVTARINVVIKSKNIYNMLLASYIAEEWFNSVDIDFQLN